MWFANCDCGNHLESTRLHSYPLSCTQPWRCLQFEVKLFPINPFHWTNMATRLSFEQSRTFCYKEHQAQIKAKETRTHHHTNWKSRISTLKDIPDDVCKLWIRIIGSRSNRIFLVLILPAPFAISISSSWWNLPSWWAGPHLPHPFNTSSSSPRVANQNRVLKVKAYPSGWGIKFMDSKSKLVKSAILSTRHLVGSTHVGNFRILYASEPASQETRRAWWSQWLWGGHFRLRYQVHTSRSHQLSCLDLAALLWCNSARLSETWFSNKWLWANWNSVEKIDTAWLKWTIVKESFVDI